jgi:hypothetical protein
MKLPTIHLNGTSAQELLDQNRAVLDAIHQLQEALSAATPNARDYYPQGAGAYTIARNEHITRQQAIQQMEDEIMAIAIHCSEAKAEKKQREAK